MIRLESLSRRVEDDARSFRDAKPFPHLVFDDLLVDGVVTPIRTAFPREGWDSWYRFEDKFQFKKHTCDRIDLIPEPLDRLILELNSGPFLSWLSRLTGIPGLLPDPWMMGGGLHSTGPGGFLLPHTDFHRGRDDQLYRRLNLLLYLNQRWGEDNGGALELWDKEKDCVVREVLPEFGRCVVFQTDAHSMHGFSRPVVGRDRDSVALYYYTTSPPGRFSGDGATHWRGKSMVSQGFFGHVRQLAYRVCMAMSYRISLLAWYVRSK